MLNNKIMSESNSFVFSNNSEYLKIMAEKPNAIKV